MDHPQSSSSEWCDGMAPHTVRFLGPSTVGRGVLQLGTFAQARVNNTDMTTWLNVSLISCYCCCSQYIIDKSVKCERAESEQKPQISHKVRQDNVLTSHKRESAGDWGGRDNHASARYEETWPSLNGPVDLFFPLCLSWHVQIGGFDIFNPNLHTKD